MSNETVTICKTSDSIIRMSILLFTVGLFMVVLLLQNGETAPNIHCNGKGQKNDPCEAITCLNGGSCATNHEGVARCTCVEGFYGHDCKIDCRTPGYTYFSSVERCFKFYDVLEERDAAQSRCASENASLIVVDSYEKDMIAKNYTRGKTVFEVGKIVNIWIGLIWLSGMYEDSKWQWVDGQLLENTYQHWNINEPDTNGDKTICVAIFSLVNTVYEEFNWNAKNCQSKYYSICEKH